MLSIRPHQIEKIERIFIDTPRQVPIVLSRAINRTSTAARTQASKSIREKYAYKHRDILNTLKIKKATVNDLNASLSSRGSALKLTDFMLKPSISETNQKKEVVVRVMKGSKKTIANGFLVKSKSGYVNIFTRVSNKRYPIKAGFAPAIPQLMGKESIAESIEQRAMEMLDKRIAHELRYILGGNS